MKIYFIVIFIFSSIYFSFSQNAEIDSIYLQLKAINSDTAKVSFLNNNFLKYEFSNSIEAEKFANKALDLSISAKYNKGKAESYTNLGFINDDQGNYDKAINYFTLAGNIYKNLNDEIGLASSYNYIGSSYKSIAEYFKAIEFIQKALDIFTKNNNTRGIATAYNNLGITYYAKNDPKNALEYYIKAVKIFEQTNDEYGVAASYSNIANIYNNLGKHNDAIDYFNKAIEINIKIGQKNWEAVNYHSLGNLYGDLKKYDKAFELLKKAFNLRESIGDQYGAASSSASIGLIYETLDSLNIAIKYFNYASEIFGKIGAMKEYASSLYSISMILLEQKKITECTPFVNRLVEIAEDIKLNYTFLNAYTSKFLLCEQKGELKETIHYLKLVNEYKDSVFLDNKQKILSEMGEKYDTEQKESKIMLLQKDKLLQNLELEKQASYRKYLIIFGILVSLIIVVLFILFQIKRKANRNLRLLNSEIMQQKEEIETQRDEITAQRDEIEKHRDIILVQKEEMHDSITYARRIQEAVLPISIEARAILGEHFILFLPKDIVSGDFYWTAQIENNLILAVADCTGHGVPGAFMSMLGISFLNEIIRKKEIITANEVLNELRKEIINALQQKGQPGEQKDGMDISLIVIKIQDPSSKSQAPSLKLQEEESEKYSVINEQSANNEQQTTNVKPQTSNIFNAQWAGANNPLWIVRSQQSLIANNQSSIDNLIELKPDKMPIAIYLKMDSFINHEITLQKGDTIYLMSDGYQDQFGGPKGKKFLSKKLKELIIANCLLTMDEQKLVLEKTLAEWIGNGQQIDDITIIGKKI